MDFTSGEWMALITAVSALVVVIGGVVVNIIVSLRRTVEATAGTVTATAEQLAKTSVKVAEVAVKVDGAASASAAEIKSLQEMMIVLRGQIADQKQTAAVLAKAAPLVVSQELNGPVIDDSATLKNIDKHTEATARNTAKTEETVKKLEQENE